MKQMDNGRAKNEALRSYNTATGIGSYLVLGVTLSNPARMVKWKNDSDVDVTISYDGITDHDIILAGDREIEDLTSNKSGQESLLRPQCQIYAKSAAGTGNLYCIVIYAG